MTVILEPEERDALTKLAEVEKRKRHFQAALIIRKELEKQGLLQPKNNEKIRLMRVNESSL